MLFYGYMLPNLSPSPDLYKVQGSQTLPYLYNRMHEREGRMRLNREGSELRLLCMVYDLMP